MNTTNTIYNNDIATTDDTNRLPNKIKSSVVANIDHEFPTLSSGTDISQLLEIALNDTKHDAHLFRISTGAGKSEKLTDVLSGLERKDWYLVVCDTNQNIDEQVKKINDYFDAKTEPTGNPSDKDYIPRYANFDHSCATALKGKFKMCNKITSDVGNDTDFKKTYANSKYIPPSECDKCFAKEDGFCNYWNQAEPVVGNRIAPNIYFMHFNTLYNEASELFKVAMPFDKEVKVYDETDDALTTVVKKCKPIKAIIVDENAFQYNKNGYLRCIIPTDVTDKKLTEHELLVTIFKSAYKGIDLNLTTEQIKKLPLIYGDLLKALIGKSAKGFNAENELVDYRSALAKKRKKSNTPFSDKTDVYLNVLRYLTTNDDKFLFGMRINEGKFIQGNIKRINNRFADTKLIYLDATMNMDLVDDAILPSKVIEKTTIDIKMSSDIKIHQLNGKTCSKFALGNNDNVFYVLNHAKQFIAKNGLKDANGGLITFQKLTINGVEDDRFVDTAAKSLWGDDYESVTNNQTRYFGNTRGYNGMKDCDYLIIIGDYNVPEHVLDNHHWNLYGEPANLLSRSVDHYNRMSDGSCSQTQKMQYDDLRTQSIYEHFSVAELEQALGRGRLIYGAPKTILVYSSMPLGSNVEISSFIDAADIFPRQVISDEVMEKIESTGFVQHKRKTLAAAIELTNRVVSYNEEDIIKDLLAAGFLHKKLTYKNERRKTVHRNYFVKDESLLTLIPEIKTFISLVTIELD